MDHHHRDIADEVEVLLHPVVGMMILDTDLVGMIIIVVVPDLGLDPEVDVLDQQMAIMTGLLPDIDPRHVIVMIGRHLRHAIGMIEHRHRHLPTTMTRGRNLRTSPQSKGRLTVH